MKYVILLLFVLSSCASNDKQSGEFQAALQQHRELISAKTKQREEYNGFANVYNLSTVLLDEEVNQARFQLDMELKKWNEDEKLIAMQELKLKEAKETHVFVSFYTPDRRQSRLDRPGSLWSFFLRIGDRKYPAQVRPIRGLHNEVTGIYPTHSRWSMPYTLIFKVPLSETRNGDVALEMVSSMQEVIIDLK